MRRKRCSSCAIFIYTAHECYTVQCTWQIFTEAAKTRERRKKKDTESTKQIRWMGPVSPALIRMEKKYTTFIFIYLFGAIFTTYPMILLLFRSRHAKFMFSFRSECSFSKLSDFFWLLFAWNFDFFVFFLKIKINACSKPFRRMFILCHGWKRKGSRQKVICC